MDEKPNMPAGDPILSAKEALAQALAAAEAALNRAEQVRGGAEKPSAPAPQIPPQKTEAPESPVPPQPAQVQQAYAQRPAAPAVPVPPQPAQVQQASAQRPAAPAAPICGIIRGSRMILMTAPTAVPPMDKPDIPSQRSRLLCTNEATTAGAPTAMTI